MSTTTYAEAIALGPGDGDRRWWFGELATVKLTSAQTGGAFSLVEVIAPAGLEVPLHVHHGEDETFVIVSGIVHFEVGGREVEAGSGAVLFAPRDVPHRYTVGDEEATMLFLFSPGGFEGFVYESSVPAAGAGLPPADVGPPADVVRIAEAYGAEILAA